MVVDAYSRPEAAACRSPPPPSRRTAHIQQHAQTARVAAPAQRTNDQHLKTLALF